MFTVGTVAELYNILRDIDGLQITGRDVNDEDSRFKDKDLKLVIKESFKDLNRD